MKTMTCKQLGGACEKELHANTFDEIAHECKNHVAVMFKENNEAHINAANEMKELMKTRGAMEKWFDNKRKEFDSLPHNK